MNKLFYCYSDRLKKALVSNGFEIKSIGVNKNTKSTFWLFLGTDELNYYKNNVYQRERDKY